MSIRRVPSVLLLATLALSAPRVTAAEEPKPDTPEQTVAREALEKAYDAAFEAADRGEMNAAALRAKLDAFLAQYPQDGAADFLVGNFLYYVEMESLEEAKAAWAAFAQHPNPKVKAIAEAKLALGELIQRPIEMKFTAADGRAVDIAAWRGKVVLIDFWATWCGPCVKEIPNVVATYHQYHEQGFEIVGISFDKAPDAAKPSPKQKTAEAMLAFTREKGMPWPQYYDGTGWDNRYGRQYGIRGIPAMFLLDKRGMVVSTNAQGPRLAPEIQRLLKE